jgi:hypothetical protein
MDLLFKHLSNIYAMDRPTLAVIAALCLIAAYALKGYMANPVLVVFAYPVLFILSVLVQYIFILGEVYVPRKLDQWLMWTIMASICGNIAGIAIVAGLGRLADALSRVHRSRKWLTFPEYHR